MANEITFDNLPQAVVYLTEQVTSSISMSFLTKFSASSPSCTPRASGGKQKLITMTLLVTLISTYARDMVTEMRAVLCGTRTASASVFTGEVWISISASGSTARAWATTPTGASSSPVASSAMNCERTASNFSKTLYDSSRSICPATGINTSAPRMTTTSITRRSTFPASNADLWGYSAVQMKWGGVWMGSYLATYVGAFGMVSGEWL